MESQILTSLMHTQQDPPEATIQQPEVNERRAAS